MLNILIFARIVAKFPPERFPSNDRKRCMKRRARNELFRKLITKMRKERRRGDKQIIILPSLRPCRVAAIRAHARRWRFLTLLIGVAPLRQFDAARSLQVEQPAAPLRRGVAHTTCAPLPSARLLLLEPGDRLIREIFLPPSIRV